MVLLQDMILPQHQSQDPRPHKYLRAVDEETRRPLRDRFCKLVRMADEKIRKNEPMSSSCPWIHGQSWEAWTPARVTECYLEVFPSHHTSQCFS